MLKEQEDSCELAQDGNNLMPASAANIERDEGDLHSAIELLVRNIGLSAEERACKSQIQTLSEIKECTNIMRYQIKSLCTSPQTRIKAITLDVMWKFLILAIDIAFCQTRARLQSRDRETKEGVRQEIEIVEERAKISERKAAELEATGRARERRNAELLRRLREEKTQQDELISAKNSQIQELLNPQRFIYVHHFLSEFQHKFTDTAEARLGRLQYLLDTFLVLRDDADPNLDLNDEVKSNVWNGSDKLPPSMILVLRKLQQSLQIGTAQIRSREKKVQEELESLRNGKDWKPTFADAQTLTEPLKELDFSSKLTNEKAWRIAFQAHNLKGVAPAANFAAIKTVEKYVDDKLRCEIVGIALWFSPGRPHGPVDRLRLLHVRVLCNQVRIEDRRIQRPAFAIRCKFTHRFGSVLRRTRRTRPRTRP